MIFIFNIFISIIILILTFEMKITVYIIQLKIFVK